MGCTWVICSARMEKKGGMTMELREKKEGLVRHICAVGRQLAQAGYVAANDGNISVRCPDGHILITPTGVYKGELTPELLLELTAEGEVVERGNLGPSSETPMHLALYAACPEVGAVVHTHSPYALCMAGQGEDLTRPVTADSVILLGRVPVLPYLPLGTPALAEGVAQAGRGGARAALLACHGAVTWGKNLEQAWFRAQALEHYCHQLWLQAQLPRPGRELTAEEAADLRARYRG